MLDACDSSSDRAAPSGHKRRKNLDALDLHTLLVPIDFSDSSLRALRHAMHLAGGLGASAILLQATDRC